MPLVLDYSDSLKRRPQGQTRRSTSLLSIESMISGMQLLPTGYRGVALVTGLLSLENWLGYCLIGIHLYLIIDF